MAWIPTPPAQIPPPDEVLALLDRAAGEPTDGYITDGDLKAIIQALLSYGYARDVEVTDLRARVAALEAKVP